MFENIFEKSEKRKLEEQDLDKPEILIDDREKNALVASELVRLGCQINFVHLEVGDYIVKEVIIERKTIGDFLSSMINKRMESQLDTLMQYENKEKLLIIEGTDEKDLYSSGINENAVRGFILSILLKRKIPIIFTKDYEDTAEFIKVLYNKKENSSEKSANLKRKSRNPKEQTQYIIESFPGIGPKNAKKLLEHFGSIKNIINASKEELEKVIGKKAFIFGLSGYLYDSSTERHS
ncbi:hypothetical protein J4463_00990 [Candidatus Pacearchaeota archaeon]|nr:hypothetical protein [Candidatus Pacearchaeota archaeon]